MQTQVQIQTTVYKIVNYNIMVKHKLIEGLSKQEYFQLSLNELGPSHVLRSRKRLFHKIGAATEIALSP